MKITILSFFLFGLSTCARNKWGGCPNIHDLSPVTDDKKFIGAYLFDGKPKNGYVDTLSCMGQTYNLLSGEQKSSTDPTIGFQAGSLIVMPGCTFYGFGLPNYSGKPTVIKEGTIIRDLPRGYWRNIVCFGKVSCLASYLVECVQSYPDCTPQTEWKVVAEFDNSESTIPASFSYKKTVGSTWSKSMAASLSISNEVSAEVSGGIEGIFSAKLGFKLKTEIGSSTTTTKGGSTTKELDIEVSVPAGKKVAYYQTVATCGGSTFHTQLVKMVEIKSH